MPTKTPSDFLKINFGDFGPGWEQWFLITSDRHWDNPHSNWKLQRKHLKQARERGALVIDLGDFFCLMQGKYDPRANKGDLRPEHQTDTYVDSVIDTAVDFFGDYADMFLVIGRGNHEIAFKKRHETDVTRRFVNALNDRVGSDIVAGGVRGYVLMKFNNGSRSSPPLNFYWHHGYGGGGPVTKNVIQTNRMAVYLPDADVVAMGHVHEYWTLPITRSRLTDKGVEYSDVLDFVSVPTYKEEFVGASEGYHHDNGRPPKPIGAAWLRLFYEWDNERGFPVVSRDIMMAR